MKDFKEFSQDIILSEKELEEIRLDEDRMQTELISYCDSIKRNMKNKKWHTALSDAKNLVKILEMVI